MQVQWRLLIACGGLAFWAQSAAGLQLTTEEYPPFNMRELKSGAEVLSGVSVDKVRELMRRAQQSYQINLYPWTRAYQLALVHDDSCVFSTTRTPEREALFKWVGPLVQNNWTVFARADDKRRPHKFEDLKPYVMGGYQTDAVGEYLKLQGLQVDLAASDSDNLRKLLSKRFDYWATGELAGHWLIKSHQLQGKIVPLFNFRHTSMYLACNIKMPQDKITQWNAILREMERDGTVEAIEKKYR
ncbi:ABC transporter substrate-binding protein [Massilia sp. W12]|uniref:substrate-binding periplasmic protein n=1 Tax=Massilia sp. W12 TaxID=3126507 RepID=UPI0030D10BBF